MSVQIKRFTQDNAAKVIADLFQIKIQICTLLAIAICAGLCGCGTARVAARHEIAEAPGKRPAIIYVSDFDLEASNIKSSRGVLPALPMPSNPFGDIIPPLPGTQKDPKVVAGKLVNSMSVSLVKDLNKAGLTARRLNPGEPMPASGWLVRGVFTEVNQGNQLQRSVIGFGLGKTDLQVLVDIKDLSDGPPKLFYEINAEANSGKAPGAGPSIILGPAGVAARYVISSKDLDRNVKQTASKIAAEVVERTKQTPQTLAAGF